MGRLDRFAALLLTTGLVVWIEGIITIEWTYPYCLDRSDGPAYAAHGMPLPYLMWPGSVSLEHDFMPHVYILNILLLCLLMFPVVRLVWNRIFLHKSAWLRRSIGALGVVLLISKAAFIALMLSIGYLRPETSLGIEPYHRYSDFRPVRIGFQRSTAPDCIPSQFWFPNGWQHD